MKDNVTHSYINNHMRELNSGAGAKVDDTYKMEEDPPTRKNKSRESKKRKKDRKNKEKERSHCPDPESSPQSLRKVNFWQPEKRQTNLKPLLQNDLYMIKRIKGK